MKSDSFYLIYIIATYPMTLFTVKKTLHDIRESSFRLNKYFTCSLCDIHNEDMPGKYFYTLFFTFFLIYTLDIIIK
jgi:hypothetical protein